MDRLGDALLERASLETALSHDRLKGERTRTTNQLRLFAGLVRSGEWKDIRIDVALPDRQPGRRPDLRRTMIPIGPVGVWAASNFPLAFSVAGGDTASALAAGCPVIVKAHPGHPGTSELAARAIERAIKSSGVPAEVFSLLQGVSPDVSLDLVRHPKLAVGAFTGSLAAGRALFDAAAARPVPIPFFAEMGSTNPTFLLQDALAERGMAIADGLFQSVTLGVGQFCTCPGVVLAVESPELAAFAEVLRVKFRQAKAGAMLTASIERSYRRAAEHLSALGSVATFRSASGAVCAGEPILFETSASSFLNKAALQHEVFGPATVLVRCSSVAVMEDVARRLDGSLTATIHGTQKDLEGNRALITTLMRKAGRIVLNGFPTGVEVCASMQHGGPYPATSDPRFTSVGTAAIQRFARPICFQDFPPDFLPKELRGPSL
jgi:NADP-dependent aldehyde dehydrogenase